MTLRKTLAAATSSIAIAFAAAPVVVTGALPAAAQTAETQPAETYSAEQLDAFVDAFMDVTELRDTFTRQLQAATDETEQQEIIEEGNAAIVGAITDVDGMDVELYSAILEQAGSDPDLNARVTRRLQEATEG